MIRHKILCLLAVLLAGVSVLADVDHSLRMLSPLLLGYFVASTVLICLTLPRAVLVSTALLPWSTIIGSSKIHFPLAASAFVFSFSGNSLHLLCVYLLTLTLSILCLWNAIAPKNRVLPRSAIACSAVLSMVVIWPIHLGWSWYVICATECILLSIEKPEGISFGFTNGSPTEPK